MPQPQILTYYDAIASGMDFVGGTSSSASQRTIRKAVHDALREVAMAGDWSFLYKQGRVFLKEVQSDGTVAYDHTGGTYERQLTLTDDTWPADAENWVVKIGDAVHFIAGRKSDTVVTLDTTMNPGEDVASGTSYTAYPLYYALPSDFQSLTETWGETADALGTAVPYSEMLALHRTFGETGDARYFCIHAVADLLGTQGLYVWPPSDADRTLDFMYKRHARQLRYTGHDSSVDTAGTVTVAEDGTAVTGSGTAFDEKMVGSIIRFGDTSYVPDGLGGVHQSLFETTIASVTDATHLTLSTESTAAFSAVKYCITDPLDIDIVAFNLFEAALRSSLAESMNMKDVERYKMLARQKLSAAKIADFRVTQRLVAGGSVPFSRPLCSSTYGDDDE